MHSRYWALRLLPFPTPRAATVGKNSKSETNASLPNPAPTGLHRCFACHHHQGRTRPGPNISPGVRAGTAQNIRSGVGADPDHIDSLGA